VSPTDPTPPAPAPAPAPVHTTVCIIGSGFAGLGMAARLRQEGIDDLVLLERAGSVGGTWRDNVYPGAACDIPSHLYSLSFDLNPDWEHTYARQPEIRAYLEAVTDRHGLRSQVHFHAEVMHAAFDAETGRWRVETRDGRVFVARFLVSGVGALRDARFPEIPGMGRFDGPSMHSAEWDATVELRGRRVGVIGTGASAIQLVPELAKEAGHLSVFQRTPSWVIPRHDEPYTDLQKAAFRHVPGLMRVNRLRLYLDRESRYPIAFGQWRFAARGVERLLKWHIRRQISDPVLAAQMSPDYALGCKRVLISNDWYPAFARDNVTLETTGIAEVLPTGVRLADGRDVALDALVYCTGFKVDQPLGDMRLTGLDNQDLGELWGTRPRAWLGITVPGFPNAFLLLGPNTALGHNSVVVMIEAQIRYVLQAIRAATDLGERTYIDVDNKHLDEFLAWVDSRHEGQVWASGCNSWYLSSEGENFTIWPGSTVSYVAKTRRFDLRRYTVGGTTGQPVR
jgi:cation diffusion facilitator CzcD-associated flavoprotein CzcO